MSNITAFQRSGEHTDPARYAHAVQLAAAFVANGDIRRGQCWDTALAELADAIPLLYQMLGQTQAECAQTDDAC